MSVEAAQENRVWGLAAPGARLVPPNELQQLECDQIPDAATAASPVQPVIDRLRLATQAPRVEPKEEPHAGS